MSREEQIKRVIELITRWVAKISAHNYIDFYDINKVSEDLALKLLNEIYGYHLENLNYEKANYPGIDLGDKINKIGFQITSRKDTRKIQESLEKFARGPSETYSKGIRFLILSQEKKPRLSKEKYRDIYPNFDHEEHIITTNDLISEIRRIYDIDNDKFYRIKDILEDELAVKEGSVNKDTISIQANKTIIQPTRYSIDYGVTFVGREKELKQIRDNIDIGSRKGGVQMITGRLFSIDGAGGVGKTTLALEAAKQMSVKFKDGVLAPIRVDEHTPVSFAMHLASQFHLKVDEPQDASHAQALVTTILEKRHSLLVLDNAVEWKNLKYMLPTQTCSVILVTTRNREIYDRLRLYFSRLQVQVHEIELEKFTEKEALALFRRMLGKKYSAKEDGIYLEIAGNLGFLPIALRQAISLMLFGPHYTASKLRDKLTNEDRLELLRRGNAEEESDCLTVESVFDMSSPLLNSELIEAMEYLAVCCPGPVHLDFLLQLSQNENIEERLEKLHTFSWCERREIEKQRYYELHQLVRELVKQRFSGRFRGNFTQLVHNIFTDESVHFSVKDRFMPQLEEAFALAVKDRDERLIDWLHELYYFCTYRGLTDFYIRLTRQVEELFPKNRKALGWVYGHRALILRRQGKLEEAMSLHKEEEKIKKEVGDPKLAACYGNQALILRVWGKLEEAMNLHKKEEKIKEELGERAGLAACYGNQAGILYILGKLEDAMAHYKKQEESSKELGDRSQLASSYCGQALILRAWDKLEEAILLHKKEEKMKEELDDRAGLAISWWNQGYIYEKKRDYQKQVELWRKSIEINKTIGIATENLQNALEKLLEKTKQNEV